MDLLKDLSIDKIRNAAEDALNQVKPKTDVEARVYEVLSHKNWGAASSIMNQIAADTFDYEKFAIITRIMWENVETQRPSAWRVIFKGLTLVEHLVKNGSERCVDDARNHGHLLRQLHQFNYYEGTIDRGLGVREKSKQLVEMLSDNDRIREERQKSRKLREKFGKRSMTAAGGGGGGGYGNSNDGWNSGGGGGGGGGGGNSWDQGNDWNSGGGYANSGIDSGKGRSPNNGGARGRYDNERDTQASAGPTFAQVPTKKKTGTKAAKPKKKKPIAAAPAPAPEVDLFSFDDPSPAPAAPAPAASNDDDDFGGFQSSGGGGADPFGGDPFASGGGAPAPAPPAAADPFAAPAATQQPNAGMNNMNDMFGNMNVGGGGMMGGANPMMGGNAMMGGANPMMGGNMMGGNNAMMGGAANPMMGGNNAMMGGGAPAPAPPADDDDFGDFEGGASSQAAAPAAAKSNDPFGNLVSLDGLSKNEKKVDKLSQPIVVNAAAAQFMQDKTHGVGMAAPLAPAKSNAMSFAGIDGLQKAPTPAQGMGMGMGMGGMGGMGMSAPAPPPSGGMNSSVMGGSGGNASLIGALDPATMNPQKPAAQPQGGGGMAMNPQMMQAMMMNPQMMQQMVASGQMTPQQQQQMMQMMQMMMMQQQQQGGGNMMGNNMMGGQGGQMGGGWGS